MKKRVFTQTFGVAGAIIEQGDRFLLVKEGSEKNKDGGKWSHPAGWIEVGESPVDSVKREVKEETGYDFEPTHVLGVFSLVREIGDDTLHAIKIIFTGEIKGDPVDLADDVVETKWFTSSEIEEMDDHVLRDVDIKDMIDDYIELERYPLGVIEHTVADPIE